MSSRLFLALFAVLAALVLALGAYAGTARSSGGTPDRVVVAVTTPPPDDPNSTCIACV
ncbi:hypothetical protein [Actinoplanes sp. NPDC049681]|uniref:hypothetical protein n=1 Tax=Actinoplanes sp. NPDC049681 TaxID=3363905 RepID=UPI003789844A